MTPEQALPLFSASGEMLWIPGWEPNLLIANLWGVITDKIFDQFFKSTAIL